MAAVLERLEATRDAISSGELAEASGVTRQAAHYHLQRAAEAGRLERVGAGRGARYLVPFDAVLAFSLDGLAEDEVWSTIVADVEALGARSAIARINRFAVTEMVNNAIDHSGGTEVQVRVAARELVRARVTDDGVGVFAHLRDRLGLPDLTAAAFELTKGKRTTAPQRHSGQGIFFTSRIVDRFGLEANGLALVVERALNDFAITTSNVTEGTLVWWEVDARTARDPGETFSRFTDGDVAFTRTEVPVAAIAGTSLLSRAEGKRVTDGLERFAEAVIDLDGVREVGQAFIDEVFRVWRRTHPSTRLTAVNADPVVEPQIDAALRSES